MHLYTMWPEPFKIKCKLTPKKMAAELPSLLVSTCTRFFFPTKNVRTNISPVIILLTLLSTIAVDHF